MDPVWPHEPLKIEEVRDIWDLGRTQHINITQHHCWLWGQKKGHKSRDAGSFWKLRSSSSWQPMRTWGPQSCNHKEVHSAHDLNKQGSRFFPEPPSKNTAYQYPAFSLKRPSAEVLVEPSWDFWPTELWDKTSIVLSHSVCGGLLEQHEETNTAPLIRPL